MYPRRDLTVRLACIRPAASVHPEPGSNSPLYISFKLIIKIYHLLFLLRSELFIAAVSSKNSFSSPLFRSLSIYSDPANLSIFPFHNLICEREDKGTARFLTTQTLNQKNLYFFMGVLLTRTKSFYLDNQKTPLNDRRG